LLTQNSIGHPFIELLSVDSTNNYAMGLAHAGMAQHGTAVFAHHQTKGRGQRGKQWVSDQGQNIAMSIVVAPSMLAPSEMFLLSMAVAKAVACFFNHQVQSKTAIKWPNDIYWCDRKAGGILIENILQGQDWKYAIIGIGLNINQTEFEGLENKAVSLRQIIGKEADPVALAKDLCTYIDQQIKQLVAGKSMIVEAYQQLLYKRDEWVRLKKGSRVFDARIKGVSNAGALIVQHAAEERFEVGDVEWII
jgi:BirA family biotin operon repressor/biotin-[acetyl-CoA-carboxylase] ligase